MVTGTGGYPGVSDRPAADRESPWDPVYAAGMDPGATDPDGLPQGWYIDPFAVHGQRWFSQGSPTALVRDGRTEAQDPPPDGPLPGPLRRATPIPHPGPAAADLKRGDDRDRAVAPDGRSDRFAHAAPPGMVGTPITVGRVHSGMQTITVRTDRVPVAPKRIVWTRWAALGFAMAWTLVLAGLLCTATTTDRPVSGPTHTLSVVSADPGGVAAFVALLTVAVTVTGLGFVRRVRAHSEAPGRVGFVFAGLLGVLGVLSLASIGLTLLILGLALAVVARPLKRPRPLPGERVPTD